MNNQKITRKRMDLKMKNLVKVLMLVVVLGFGFVVGVGVGSVESKVVETEKEKVKVEFMWYQQGDIQELEGYYLEDGDTLIELSDGSWAICNYKKNLYVFQPVDLGDWDYEVETAKQLQNIMKTYVSMKNNGWY